MDILNLFNAVIDFLTSEMVSALICVYFGSWITKRDKRSDEKQTSRAIKALFLSCLYSYDAYLKSRNPKPWKNYFWYKHQIEVAKYFPQQAHEFALLLEGYFGDSIAEKSEKLHAIGASCKNN